MLDLILFILFILTVLTLCLIPYLKDFSLKFRFKARHLRAISACRKHLIHRGKYYRLQNDNVVITFDEDSNLVTCKNSTGTLTVTIEQAFIIHQEEGSLKYIFDTVCLSFNENTQFNDVTREFASHFVVAVTEKKENELSSEFKEKYQETDINNSCDEEIAKLPGVNIILAKKIVRIRDLQNGFKDKEDFFEKVKMKPSLQNRIKNFIKFGEIKTNSYNSEQESERTLDF